MKDDGSPRRASEWLAALLERPDDLALRRRFDAWLAVDPVHRADWAEMARTYEVMGRTAPQHRGEWVGWAATRERPRRLPHVTRPAQVASVTHRIGRRLAFGAIAAGIAAAIALLIFPMLRWQFIADHVTATAEVKSITLADGSTVRLAPQSAIDIAYADGTRDVRLLEGTAFFEVKRDPNRPFKVEANAVETTVLGTAFEVRTESEDTRVAVRQGTVRVARSDGTHPEMLKAGDWVSVAPTGAVARGRQPTKQVAAWMQGHLVVKDRSVADVVDALRPYYRGVVIVRGETLGKQPVTGLYDLTNPIAALKAIADAVGAETYQLSPWVLVIEGS